MNLWFVGRENYNRSGRNTDVSRVSGAKVTGSKAVGGLVSFRPAAPLPVGPRVSNGIFIILSRREAVDADSTGRTAKCLTMLYTCSLKLIDYKMLPEAGSM